MGRNRREMMEQRSWKLNWRYVAATDFSRGRSTIIQGYKERIWLEFDTDFVKLPKPSAYVVYDCFGRVFVSSSKYAAFCVYKQTIILLFNIFNPYNPYLLLQRPVVTKPDERTYELGLAICESISKMERRKWEETEEK